MLQVAVVADDPLTQAGLVALLEAQQIVVIAVLGTEQAGGQSLDSLDAEAVVWAVEGHGDGAWQSSALRAPILLLVPDRDVPEYDWRSTSEEALGGGADVPGERYRDEPGGRVAGVLTRGVSGPRLAAALAAVAAGLVVLEPELAVPLAFGGAGDRVASSERPLGSEPDLPLEPLSARETEILRLVADGFPNKAIAKRLELSEHTVKFHLNSLFAKLAARNRTEAVSKAIRHGLISL